MKKIVSFLLLAILISCSEKFKDADLIERYVSENEEKFEHRKEYYLLFLRYAPLQCIASAQMGYDNETALKMISDSLNNEEIFVLCDHTEPTYSNYSNKLQFLYEKPSKLDEYGIPYKPHLFKIKNNKIIWWKPYNIKYHAYFLQ